MKKMIKQLFDATFWKFILVGITNTIFGTGIMFLFYNVFHFSYWISSASNYIFGSILSYILNRVFTFKSGQKTKTTVPKFIINISICYFVAYGLARPIISSIVSGYGETMRDNVAMLVGMFLFVGLNYLGQKFFVFKSEE
jgi:putative flippase GtrA